MARLGASEPVPADCSPTRFFRSHYKPIAGAKQRPTGDYDAITGRPKYPLQVISALSSHRLLPLLADQLFIFEDYG